MKRIDKILLGILVFGLVFLFGMFFGEKKVLNYQQISSSNGGYAVIYEGNEYFYY